MTIEQLVRLNTIDLNTQQITGDLKCEQKSWKITRCLLNWIPLLGYGKSRKDQMHLVALQIKNLVSTNKPNLSPGNEQAIKSLVSKLIQKLENSRHVEALQALRESQQTLTNHVPAVAAAKRASRDSRVTSKPHTTRPPVVPRGNLRTLPPAPKYLSLGNKPIVVEFPKSDQSTLVFGKSLSGKTYWCSLKRDDKVGALREQCIRLMGEELTDGIRNIAPEPNAVRIIFCGKQLSDNANVTDLLYEGMFHIVMKLSDEEAEKRTAKLFLAHWNKFPQEIAQWYAPKIGNELNNENVDTSLKFLAELRRTILSMYDRLVRGKSEGHERALLKPYSDAIKQIYEEAKATVDGGIQCEIEAFDDMIDHAINRYDTILEIRKNQVYQGLLAKITEALKNEGELMSHLAELEDKPEPISIQFSCGGKSKSDTVNLMFLGHFVPPVTAMLSTQNIDTSTGITIPISSLEITPILLKYIKLEVVDFQELTTNHLIALAYTAHEYAIEGLEAHAVLEIMTRAASKEIVEQFQKNKLPGLLGKLQATGLFTL